MQMIQFDIKTLMLSFLLLLGGCGLSAQTRLDLPMPKENPKETIQIIQSKQVATVLLLSNEGWYCYADTNLNKGTMYTPPECEKWLVKKKKEFGDSLLVLLRPSGPDSYKATVDALDYLQINEIKRFAIVKMSPKEKGLFPSSTIDDPMRYTLSEPEVTTDPDPDYPVFVIELRKDQSTWYGIQESKADTVIKKIDEPVKNNLSRLIADFKKHNQGKKTIFLVKGYKESKYKQFEDVIAALRENDEFKYNLVTVDNW